MDSTDHRCLADGEHGTLTPHTHARSLGPPTGLPQQPHPSAAPGLWCVLSVKGPARWHQRGTNQVGFRK